MVLEPLASFDSEGNLFPVLAESIPTLENGGVSEDLLTITYTLREGLLFERRLFHALFATEDQSEGMGAFLEKREPQFRDK